MKIKVIGIKKVVNDNPNMGKMMNGAHVHFTYSDNNVIGEAADHKWLNNGQYPIDCLEIGKEYEVEIFRHIFCVFHDVKTEEV